ncbi:MAG: hypothetical protein H0W96_11780 [Solirubrobacterales bacterium]|nr:hypothetical protein [Solirubrobacterales bacterium]
MPACFGAAARDRLQPCVNPDLDRGATPSPYEAALEPGEPCERISTAKPPACSFGVARAQAVTSVALLGDSHSTHWRAALAHVARKRRWHGVSINRNLCPLTLARTTNHERCKGWTRGVLRWLRNHREVKAVFVSANAISGVRVARGRSHGETKVDGYLRAWQAIPSSVREIFVLRDVPHSRGDTAECVTSAVRHGHNPSVRCARPRERALLRDLEAAAAEQDPADRAQLIDLSSYMCDDEQCMPVIGGALVIKDIGHMTRTFARTLGPYLGREVDRLRSAR